MCDGKVTYIITVSVDTDTNGVYYASCPGIKGIHVNGYTKQEAIEEALKSAVNMVEIYHKKGEPLPENEHFYMLKEPTHSYDLSEDDVLMPISTNMADTLEACEQGL